MLRRSIVTVAALAATMLLPAVAGAASVGDVTLDWTGSGEIQGRPPFGGSNYMTAGVTDGSAAGYTARAGNVQIVRLGATGAEYQATYATRAAHVGSGGRQIARLFGGSGSVAADGSGTIAWNGAFTLNFYGGLVPFTISRPVLSVDGSGHGTLKGDLSGYGSSKDDPNTKVPLTPVSGVTIATFSNVSLTPPNEAAITPDFDGVAVTLPAGQDPQYAGSPGWGAWPQAFVDFQVGTGLAPYWYSTGGAFDSLKKPLALRIRFTPVAWVDPPAESGPKPPDGGPPGPPGPPGQPPPTTGERRPTIKLPAMKLVRLSAARTATLATLSCPSGPRCTVTAPARITLRIAGRSYRTTVLAPKRVAGGRRAYVRLRLTNAAARRLQRRSTKVTLKLRLSAAAKSDSRKLVLTLRGRR